MARATPGRVGEFFRRMFKTDEARPEPVEQTGVDPAVVAMLRALGAAMVQAGRATNDTDVTLHNIALAYGAGDVRILVMPTAIIIQLVGETTTTEIDSIDTDSLRLDQIGAIDKVIADATNARLHPVVVMRRLDEIRASEARFHPVVKVIGHIVLTLGFGMALDPTIAAIPAYAILGAVVGVLVVVGRPGTILGDSLPIVAAFTVTVLTGTLLQWAVRDDPVRVITPPLVSFLPGLVLTIAAIELTHGQVIAGASRLVYGLSRLMVLAFGLVAGIAVVGDIVANGVLPTTGLVGTAGRRRADRDRIHALLGSAQGFAPMVHRGVVPGPRSAARRQRVAVARALGIRRRTDHHPPHPGDRTTASRTIVGRHDAAGSMAPGTRCIGLHRRHRGGNREGEWRRVVGLDRVGDVRDLARCLGRIGDRSRCVEGEVNVAEHRLINQVSGTNHSSTAQERT